MKKIYLFVLITILLSCVSPQKLIDRAIKKDPSIVNGYSDTLTLNKYFVDSFLVIRNDTSFFEKVVKVVEFDTIINTQQINIERKKTRQEVRKNSRLERLIVKKDSRITELELKNSKIQSRLDAKTKQKENKQTEKTDRTTVRQENKKNGWFWFWIGFFVGIIIIIILYLIFKYFTSTLEDLTK